MKVLKKELVNFTHVSNEILKQNVSLKAIGLYLYIASKPDNWDFSLEGTASQVRDGIDSIRSAAKELEAAGFLKRERERNSNGVLGESIWYIYQVPLEKPTEEKPTLVKPTQVKQPQVITNIVTTKKVNTNKYIELTHKKPSFSFMEKLTTDYQVPMAFVESKWDDLVNYCMARGRNYKRWDWALRDWVKRDAIKLKQESYGKSSIAFYRTE